MIKTCYIGFPDWFIQLFTDLYHQNSDEYTKTKAKCPFFFALGKHNSSYIVLQLQHAKIPYDYYTEDIKTFKKFSCFKNIIIWDSFNLSHKFAENYYFSLLNILDTLLKNEQNVFYCTTDLIFEPKDDFIYNNTSHANSEANNVTIQAFKYIDILIKFMKLVRKFPVNRIVVPYIITSLNDRVNDIKGYLKQINLTSFPKRNCIKKEDIVKIFYNQEWANRNYMISTNFYRYEYEFYLNLFKNTTFKHNDCIYLEKDLYLEVNEQFYNL